MGRKNWVGLAIAAETANGNRSANARGQTAVTIRVAMQPPIRLRRSGASCVLEPPRRPAYFNSLARSLRYLINRTPDEFGNRSARLVGQLLQLLDLLLFQEEGCPLHGQHSTIQAYIWQ